MGRFCCNRKASAIWAEAFYLYAYSILMDWWELVRHILDEKKAHIFCQLPRIRKSEGLDKDFGCSCAALWWDLQFFATLPSYDPRRTHYPMVRVWPSIQRLKYNNES